MIVMQKVLLFLKIMPNFRQRFFRNGIMIVDIERRLQRGEQPKI